MTAHSGMKRLLLAVLSWMIAMAAFGAQSRTAQVIYTYHDALKESVYRVADECYAPVFSVEDWGWKVQLNRDDVDLTAEGKKITVPIRTVGGRQAIPVKLALEKLGADLTWDDATNTLTAKSQVNGIKIEDNKLEISSSLPVKANVFAMDNPPRLVVDILGAKLLDDATIMMSKTSRMKQFKPDVVRVVVETPDAQKLVQTTSDASNDLTISLDPNAPAVVAKPVGPPPGENPDVDPSDPDPGAQAQAKQPTDAQPGDPQFAQLMVDAESSRSVLVLLRNAGTLTGPIEFRKPDPSTLDVVLPGAHLKLPDNFQLKTSSIIQTIAVQGTDVTVLRFTLARPMGAQVTSDNGEVRIELSKPEVGNGKLAGKIVVIDPGHGGHDTGAHSNGVYEKNLTLAISKKTADALAAAGATVIMTRKSDVFIPLLERNDIATQAGADFFIAIHINSNTLANSMSGGIAFHHKGNDTSRVLAECIQNQIAQISKLPNLGVWSDGKIYQSGFSVLRNASQPAILLELGFINDARDRARMQTQDFQDGVADAIVSGLQDYLGNGKS
jgi:N-acetylmuramoyl-L-alanine amidase